AGTVGSAAAQHAEPLWFAVFSVHADLRARYFEGRCADAGISDELGGSGRGDRGAAVCSANALQRSGEMDCGDFDDLRGMPDPFFTSEEVRDVRGGGVCCGMGGDIEECGECNSDSKFIESITERLCDIV